MSTAYEKITSELKRFDIFNAWIQGKFNRTHYSKWVHEQFLISGKEIRLSEDDWHLTTRFITLDSVIEQYIPELLTLYKPIKPYIRKTFDYISSIYNHGTFSSYIFPEEFEAATLYSHYFKSKNALYIGSFYGYWAAATTESILRQDGFVTLIDLDAVASDVSRENYSRIFGNSEKINIINDDYFSWVSSKDLNKFDTFIIDAEGPNNHKNPKMRGKRIYGAIMETMNTIENLQSKNFAFHNIMSFNTFQSEYFTNKITLYQSEMRDFYKILSDYKIRLTEIPTTEGIGITLRN